MLPGRFRRKGLSCQMPYQYVTCCFVFLQGAKIGPNAMVRNDVKDGEEQW